MTKSLTKSREWLDTWNATIGGSRAPKIAGRDADQLRVYLEMRGEVPLPDLSNNPDVRRGIMLEGIGRQLLAEHLRAPVYESESFLRNAKYPFAHASPDGWVHTSCADPCEIKWPRPAKFRRMVLNGLVEDYVIQCQHNLAVTNREKMHVLVGCCLTCDYLYVEVDRDQNFIDRLMDIECALADQVEHGIPPMPSVPRELDEWETNPLGYEHVDDPVVAAQADAWLTLRDLRDEAEEELQTIKGAMLQRSGKKAFEVNGHRFSLTHSDGRDTFDWQRALAEVPGRFPDKAAEIREALQLYRRQGKPYETFRGYRKRD